MLYLLLKLKMKQQVATSTHITVSTTKLTDYSICITWLIILGEEQTLPCVLGTQMPMFRA